MVDAIVPDSKPPLAERDLLRSLLLQLNARVRREQLETWFRSLDVARADDHDIELSVTSQFVRDWLQKNYLPVLHEAVQALGEPRRRILLTHREEDGWDGLRLIEANPMSAGLDAVLDPIQRRMANLVAPAAQAPQATPAAPPQPTAARRGGGQLNPNYTFDRFVVGSCNRLAHASALAIGENPGCAYNPLFVHGNVGLGKSHLLQAICHTVLKRDSDARVLYMSCEDFTNAYIRAIQGQQIEAFRDFHRNADLLVIDDVQFLASKEKTQDEFFHTFNALYDAQKQIVLSSDRSPIEIPTIEERLVSRFKWGLVAEVEAPCLETRAAIVRRKARGRGVDLPEEVVLLIAERVTSNIRELEGAVIKVVGIAAITEQPITRELAESCLRGVPVRHSQVSVDDVMTLVTTEFAISARELTGKSRTQTVSLPRQVAMYLLREHTESSLEDVGRIFGNRDHTTVLYAVTKIRDRLQKDRMFREQLEGLGNRLLTRSFRA
ncbi:MAG: chromosomal replication initiator protein DnaA [Planctomycetes bacterium]|nr:chromosomal replication initiator protein DnaA [Planctomycetota bacterium]